METTRLIRLGACAAVLAGVLLVIPDAVGGLLGVSSKSYHGTTLEQVGSALFLAGKVLLVPGVLSLYLYQAAKAGRFGLVAFTLALLGTTLMVGSDWGEMFVAPILRQSAPAVVDHPPTRMVVGFLLNFGVESLGWFLFGIATFRSRVFPRPLGAALSIGVLLPLVGPPWSFVLWNGVIAAMGLVVLYRPARVTSPTTIAAYQPEL